MASTTIPSLRARGTVNAAPGSSSPTPTPTTGATLGNPVVVLLEIDHREERVQGILHRLEVWLRLGRHCGGGHVGRIGAIEHEPASRYEGEQPQAG
jgi:hypothetical protein